MRGVISSVVVSVALGGFTVVAAQLPPEIMMDRYLLRAERLMAEEDNAAALDVMREIVALQRQHDLTLPDDFHFKYAQLADLEDLPEQALGSVVKYLAAAGREGQHYVEALELMNKVQVAASCKGWNTEGHFVTATLEQVTACLDTGVDLEAQNGSGSTPLHLAAQNNTNPTIIQVLIDAGTDLMAENNLGQTPLHLAAQNNDSPGVIEALLTAGADPRARTEDGHTPLHQAAWYNGNPVIVAVLLDAGADLEARTDGDDGHTALHEAAGNANPAVLETLLDAGANREARTNSGRTLLHFAAQNNENPVVIEALLAAGADLDAGDENGRTPLHEAARFNENPAVIEALLAAGADPMARDNAGWTVLHRAAWFNENPAAIETLLAAGVEQTERRRAGLDCDDWNEEEFFEDATVEDVIACLDAGADPMARDKHERRPLHWAAHGTKYPAVIELLLAAGEDVNVKSDHGDNRNDLYVLNLTPLHWAGGNLNPDVTKLLLAAGADVHARDSAGRTPLHWAAGASWDPWYGGDRERNPALIELLLAAGADVNSRSSTRGYTPLHWAADANKNQRAMELLIAAGANLSIQNRDGDVPREVARRGHKDFLRDAWAGLTPQRQEALRAAARPARQDRREANSGPGFLGAAVGILGGTAIAAAGGGTEESLAAGADFAEMVIGGETPAGSTASAPAPASTGNPGVTGAGGSCEIPGFPNPGDMQNLGLSWCPARPGDFQVRVFALQAEGMRCAVAANSSEATPEVVSRVRSQIREVCTRLDALGERLGGPTDCRCPAGFGP